MPEKLDRKALEELLAKRDFESLRKELLATDPADLADLLEDLELEDTERIFALLDPDTASDVLVEMEPSELDEVMDSLSPKQLAEMINEMAYDDAADIFADLEEDEQREVQALLDPEMLQEIRKLLGYEEDTAGGLMTPELCAVRGDATVQEAMNAISAQEFEDPITVVFAHDQDHRLIGQLNISDLLSKPRNAKIADIVEPDSIFAKVDEDQEDIAHNFRKYDLLVMPVVDSQQRLVGRITVDDVMDVMQEEANEDMAHMAGAPDIETNEDSPVKIVRLRLPWLMVTMFTGIVISVIIHKLYGLTKVEALSAFVPVIMAMGGSTGMQASAVTIRGIALGEIQFNQLLKIAFREIAVGLMMGFVCGIMTGVIVWFNMTYLQLSESSFGMT